MTLKLTTVLRFVLLSSALWFSTQTTWAAEISVSQLPQKVTLKLSGARLSEAIAQIEKTTDYIFLYDGVLLSSLSNVNVDIENADITEVLDIILPDNITYRISERQITLAEKPQKVNPQLRDEKEKKGVLVRGRVTDEFGEAVIAAYVLEKDTQNGTLTDINGEYELMVSSESAVLEYKALGYQDRSVSIGKRQKVEVVLSVENTLLDEIVVIGYGTQTKTSITGALSVVDTKKLVESPVSSITNVLAGNVPGVSSVQTSGQPGKDAATIYVRGTGSLSSELSAPLILVDGVERDFAQIDPNEIENMSILKDAASTAVFGVRGANGVILITTKRGKEGKQNISVSSNTGVQQPISLVNQVGSYEYATFWNQKMHNDGVTDPSRLFSREAIEAYRTGSDPIMYPSVNWTDMMCNDFFMQSKNNVNISGGGKDVDYFVSLGYLYQNGILKQLEELPYNNNYTYNRYNYRANVDVALTRTTKLKLNIGGYVGVSQEPYSVVQSLGNPWVYATIWANPLSGPGFLDGVRTLIPKGFVPTDIELRDSYSCFYGYGYHKDYNATLNFDAEISQNLDFVTKGLSFTLKGAYDNAFTLVKKRQSWGAEYQVAYYKSYLEDKTKKQTDPDYDKSIVYVQSGSNYPLSYEEDYGRSRNWYIEAKLAWQRNFGAQDAHRVSAIVLYNQSRNYYPSQYSYIPRSYIGYVARATYSYEDKYYADVNLGYNGSENFAPGKTRYGLFPSASLGWVVSGEEFMQSVDFIDYLKLRVSYGRVGNDISSSRFLYMPETWTQSGSYSFGVDNANSQEAYARNTAGNPGVTWETADKQNYGLDSFFLDNRLSLSFDYFFEHRTGILITPNSIPSIISRDLPARNIGVVDNQGYELAAGWSDALDGGFRYNLNATLSFARNKIVYMDEVLSKYDYQNQTGGPTGRNLLYRFERLYQYSDFVEDEDGNLVLNPDLPQPGVTVYPGDAKYADLNADGVVNALDKERTGYSTRPEYVFGLNCGIGYKGFNLSMQWTGATHVSRLLAAGTYRIPFTNAGGRGLLEYFYNDCWSEENQNGTLPRASKTSESWNSEDSTLWLKDASYLRLKSLNLSYSFGDSAFLRGIGISNLALSFTGYNLFTLTPLKYMDPEAMPSNTSDYPLVKIYSLGLNLNF